MPPAVDPIVSRQLPVIQKIIADETWLEGERRRRPVPPDDPAVRENVCQVILRIGRELRESFAAEIAAGAAPQ
jgi:hypothetical protein